MHFEDGVYIYKNMFAIVSEGLGVCYTINWYGDLAIWELWAHLDKPPVETDRFASVEEMFAAVCRLRWQPAEGAILFVPAYELPFEGHPPASLSRDDLVVSISQDLWECPVLAWAVQSGVLEPIAHSDE